MNNNISATDNMKNNLKIDQPLYSGVTTRKRAALSAINKNIDKEIRSKPFSNCKQSEKENIFYNIQNVNNNEKDFYNIMNESLIWPKSVDLIDENVLKNTFNSFIDRKNRIRYYYTNSIDSLTPIWYPSINIDDEFMHAEYLPTIIDHLIKLEEFYRPLGRCFLDNSLDVNYRHRYALVNWMVQVHERLAMSNESIQLSICMMDRYVKSMKADLKRDDLMIIGIMCLFIAGKVEEVFFHSLSDFLQELKIDYDLNKCKRLEEKILLVLDFKLSIPLPLTFIRHYNLMFKAETISNLYSRYFCELSLQDYVASGYSSNMIGASCVFLAQVICQAKLDNFSEIWTPSLQCSSGLFFVDFSQLVKNLCLIVSKQQTPSKYRAIALKYSADRYSQVAKHTIQTEGFKHILQYFKDNLN